ncbi:MAG: hypothetical protein ACYC6Y_23640 [Thermoguttaceae bacterium]
MMDSNPTQKKSQAHRGNASRIILLLLMQAVVVVAIAGAAMARRSEKARRAELPPMRRVPLKVLPLYDRPEVISDEQLLAVLYKLRPRLRVPDPKINHVDHALRFWGIASKFRDPQCLSGEEMRDLLMNHAHFAEAWGKEEPPLLECNEHCVGVRTKEGDATASHVDHTMAGLGEVGTPLDFPIMTSKGPGMMADLLVASLRTFEINQVEYEWSALAYTLYCERLAPFADTNGQEISFNRLADRLMRQEGKQGVCFGNHRLHTLTVMLQVDGQKPILSPECRQRVLDHLRQVTDTLVASQASEGFWNQYWSTGAAPVPTDDQEYSEQLDPLAKKVLATGHALEWWALAPEALLPDQEVIERAAQWLAQTVIAMDDTEITEKYTFLSHVGSALALWRGHEPAHFIEAMEKQAGSP